LRGLELLRRLDPLDLRILSLLEGGMTTYSNIARELGISRYAVYRRLAKLGRLGLLEGSKPVFGGLEYAYLLLPADPGNLDRIVEALKGNPHVLEAYRVVPRSGRLRGYRLLVRIAALNRVELQGQAERVISVAGGGLELFVLGKPIDRSTVSRILEESYKRYLGRG